MEGDGELDRTQQVFLARHFVAGRLKDIPEAFTWLPTRRIRMEERGRGLAWLANLASSDKQADLQLVLAILAFASESDLFDHLAEHLFRWFESVNAGLESLSMLFGGFIIPDQSDLDLIVWYLGPDRLQILKTMPYREFLLTTYWKCVRQVVLTRDSHQCRNCTATKSLHVHHRTYEHRGEEYKYLDDLTTLCSDCHAKFHGKEHREWEAAQEAVAEVPTNGQAVSAADSSDTF